MISSKVGDSQWSDWSTPPAPIVDSQNTKSLNKTTQNNNQSVDAIQNNSKDQPKTKSNCSCKPLQWWSSLSHFVRGILIGAFINCLTLAIILPIWLVKPSTTTTTISPINAPLLRWNTTGVTIVGVTGVASTASDNLNGPWEVVLDWSNTLYVTDRFNYRVQKFLMGAKNGTTIAGSINGINGAAANQLDQPTGIYVNSNGDIYLSDTVNNRVQLWLNGSIIGRTVVGNGTVGIENNLLFNPYGISRDENSGTLYVADSYNHRIMRYNNNATFGDVVAGGNGSGTATTQVSYPYGFYFDSFSNSLIIANAGTNTVVRWVIGASSWTLLAGTNGLSGSNATLVYGPLGVILDPMGNIYVADTQNQRIQFFSSGQSSGVTIAGVTGTSGSNSTVFNSPSSLTLDSQLNLYVVDQYNHRIQKFLRY